MLSLKQIKDIAKKAVTNCRSLFSCAGTGTEDLKMAENNSNYEDNLKSKKGPKYSDGANFNRVLVIGDIHGQYKKFISLYKKLNVTDDDLLIFLGDYIDRGPEGECGYVLEWIMKAVQKDNVIALRGNHEQMMIDFFDDSDLNWLFNGGQATATDIKTMMKDEPNIMAQIMEFANNLPLYHRMSINGKDYYFCHAGVDPKVSLNNQTSMSLLWIREEFFKHYDDETIIVVGHTPLVLLKPEGSLETWQKEYSEILKVKNVKPQWRRNGKILMMDTGSYFVNGCISCMDIKSGQLWQSD